MKTSAIALLAVACLTLCGSALGQATAPAAGRQPGRSGPARQGRAPRQCRINPVTYGARRRANPESVSDAARDPEGGCHRCDDAGRRPFRWLDPAWPHLRQSALLAPDRCQHCRMSAKLRPTAILQTGITKNFENTAIAVDGVLYLSTADNKVMAYDAITGKQLWSYIAHPVLFQPVLRPDLARRGGGLWQGVFRPARRPCRGAGCAHRQAGLEDRACRRAAPAGGVLFLHHGAHRL